MGHRQTYHEQLDVIAVQIYCAEVARGQSTRRDWVALAAIAAEQAVILRRAVRRMAPPILDSEDDEAAA